jgi:CRISPR-associated protein Csd1
MAGVIHDLAAYYDLLASDPSSGMAPLGWTRERAGIEVLLSRDGTPLSVAALATGGRHFMTVAPAHSRRGGSVVIGFPLCDNPTYTFGTVGDGGDEAHARACHLSYLTEAHAAFDQADDDGARAFLAFLDSGVLPEPAEGDAEAERALAHGSNVTFRLDGDAQPIHMRPAVREAWNAYFAYRHPADPDAPCGQDSATGATGPLARLFPSVTGIRGAQSSGASLVSFNFGAAESYGLSQSYNASLTEDTVRRAGEALRFLASSRSHSVALGDARTVLFWSDSTDHEGDEVVCRAFAAASGSRADGADGDGAGLSDALALLGNAPFHVLTLAPNAARLAVVGYRVSTFDTYQRSLDAFATDSAVAHARELFDGPYGLLALMDRPGARGFLGGVPHDLVDAFMRVVYEGAPVPRPVLVGALARIRRAAGYVNGYDRLDQFARLFRLCLARDRALRTGRGGVPMALDRDCTEVPYVLGRIFAIACDANRVAQGGTDSKLRTAFWGRMSSSPALVMGRVMRGFNYDVGALARRHPGYRVRISREMEQACGVLDATDVPRMLTPEGTALFSIGYYQEVEELRHGAEHAAATSREGEAQHPSPEEVGAVSPEPAPSDDVK